MTDADDDLAARLRTRGLRYTGQRERILNAVRRLGHATPEQLSETVDDVDLATVYRTLDLLEEIGLVRHAHLGHGAPSYRPVEDDHIHVVCHSCGAVAEVDQSLVDPLQHRLLADNDFELDRAHFTVFGRCAQCRSSDAPPSSHLSGTKHEHRAMNH